MKTPLYNIELSEREKTHGFVDNDVFLEVLEFEPVSLVDGTKGIKYIMEHGRIMNNMNMMLRGVTIEPLEFAG